MNHADELCEALHAEKLFLVQLGIAYGPLLSAVSSVMRDIERGCIWTVDQMCTAFHDKLEELIGLKIAQRNGIVDLDTTDLHESILHDRQKRLQRN